MERLYRAVLYPALLQRMDPERAHHLALRLLRDADRMPGGTALLGRLAGPADERLRVQRFGLTFRNPLGVAAGLDKDAQAVGALLALGFGAVEVGTVTPRPQPGNPSPRVWRLPQDRALINAMGFPSEGAAAVRARLVGRRFPGVVGINLGKNRDTPPECAARDYVDVLNALWDVANYVVVNVSSPNTPGLRDLQQRTALVEILRAVGEANARAAALHRRHPHPVLVKIAPDLDDAGLDDVLAGAIEGGAAGVVVCNTTVDRSGLQGPVPDVPGGLSGPPLRARATALVREVRRRAGDRLAIIGVGGISSAADVIERMRAGACLVQMYTAFVYGGPALPGAILRDLVTYLDREGLRSIEDLIGSE
ncbi:quinone-dependent dihydroorotate dehydrogenase [Sphaerobacter sp.]|uniref:quinone-dependent dihydroorotate dehydrogenase n=1 Tax=Sphaerobacter sp. TaxID=2099654 RepID=UPI001D68E118|nr:quinone-dependent dihydroorotate dehydrogenase [Sphaerobacter sp.]MBX5445499.1 quinone-dependent dihydroorotate dehydrogenase [Sphaerobacter sp.]